MKKYLSILVVALLAVFASCSDDNDNIIYTVTFDSNGGTAVLPQEVKAGETATVPANPSKEGYTFLFWHESGISTAYNFQTPVYNNITLAAQWDDKGGLAAVAAELAEDTNYSLFAAVLVDLSAESGSYTVFALPDSIIRTDTDVMHATDIQWHVVNGKYRPEELLQTQSLQTVGGKTLMVVCETIEVSGEPQTFLYINDVPVDYSSAQLISGSVVYPVGTNIARISNTPGTDDLDAYNSWAVLAIEGTWVVERSIKRKYHVWSVSGRENAPFEEISDPTYIGCREVFRRDPAKVKPYGCAGTYETEYRSDVSGPWHYCQKSTNGPRPVEGCWSVDADEGCIIFYEELQYLGIVWLKDWFYFGNGIGRTMTYATGYGGDGYYGGDQDEIFDTYYETEWTLRKVPNREY